MLDGIGCRWVWMLAGGVALFGCENAVAVIAEQREAGGEPSSGGSAGAGGRGDAGVSRPRFGAPVAVEELNDPEAKDQDPTLTADLLEIFFFSDRGGNEDLWTSRRADRQSAWEPPERVAEVSSDDIDLNPMISPDGLRLWFYSRRSPSGIWYSERPSREEPFAAPVSVPIEPPEGGGLVIAPSLTADELRMAISIGEASTHDIYEVVRPHRTASWGPPALVTGLNSDAADSTPFLIDDGRQLLMASARTGNGDLYWAYRESVGSAVSLLEPLEELNDAESYESHPHLAADGSVIFFGSDRTGGTDLFEAPAR